VEAELEISARRLTEFSVELNASCPDTRCAGNFNYIFTNLSCDKSARWCQVDLTAMAKDTHEAFVATLPFTPAGKTRAAFDAAVNEAIGAFERAPKSGRLAPVVMQAQQKPAVAARPVAVAEPLANKPQPTTTRPIAVAPKPVPAPVAAPAPTPAPVKAAPVKASASPAPVIQRANKNMAD